jgi:hypothetical protein
MYESKRDKRKRIVFDRALKAFNKMLANKSIDKITKKEDSYFIQYRNGQVFTCSGALCEAANIPYQVEK